MEKIAGNAALEVGKCLSAPIGRQFMYLYNYKTNFHNLERGAGKLKDARDEVKAKVLAAENNVEKIKQNVKDWEGDVDSTIEETDKLIQEKSNSSCFNLITYYKNGRKAWKKLNAITELLKEKVKFAEVSLPTAHEVIRLTNKDYEEFESRRSVFNDVLKSLDDPEVGIIGVYGMGGIGKTTLVKEVGHQAKKNQTLDEVVFVEVSDKPDTKKIQDELAHQLGVKFDPEADRASKLYARLKNDKKVLVILDNIWERLDLEALGIPCGDDRGGCKLLLTARDVNVLWSMDSKNNFSMGVLKEEEAWSLFKKMAGDVIDQTSKLNSLPNDVCNECRGLPIVITTIARALRNKRHQSQWKEALRELKMPSPTKFAGLLEKEYSKIALSYNYLKGDELKKTFLICSLMVNNTTISDLFKLIMGLDILEGVNLTMEQARNKLESLVYELKESCLLLDDSNSEMFSMHDVVRSVAITIAYRDHHVFTERNDIVMEWLDKEQLKKCSKISLSDCNMISEIWSQGLDYPKLEFFSTRMNDSFEILEDFFEGMGNLKVLSFLHLDVLSLPTSLRLLTNLQTLCLDYGTFSDITFIGELRKLKILSLQCCKIKQLAEEISKLTQLRLLDLSYCRELKVIAPNVISSLSRLEELYMKGCTILWKVEVLEELKHLSQLTTLEIDISDDQRLPKDFISKKLERYKISIGNEAINFGGHFIDGDDYSKYMKVESCSLNKPAALRTLKLNLNSFIWQEELQLLSNVEFLCLEKLQGIKNDLSELDKKGFSHLKYLYVHNNLNILCIVDSTKCTPHDIFPLLESLVFYNLTNLEKICYGLPSTKSFFHLKFIEVKSCDKLENIFSFSNASKSLPQLQLIKVEDCKNLTKIFAVESKNRADKNEVIDKIEFCQLRFLTLINLPRIASFYSNANTVSTSQKTQKELTINLESSDIISEDEEIDTVIPFFNQKVVFPYLEELKLEATNFEKIWDNKLLTTSCCYQSLKKLIVDGCQKLKFVFPSSIIKSFEQLQHLEISWCKELKEIVAKEETEGTTTFIFPRVTFLKFKKLPELTTFYHGKHNSSWPILKELEVHDCSRLDIFILEYKNLERLIVDGFQKQKFVFPPSIIESFKQLQHLEIRRCKELKEIVVKEEIEDTITFTFPRLAFLKLEELSELTTLYYGKYNSNWLMLKELEIRDCNRLDIFTSEYKVVFPCLEELKLEASNSEKIWDNKLPTTSCCYQNLKKLIVDGCQKLKFVFSSSIIKSFEQLQHLEISCCKELKEIVAKEETEGTTTFIFPRVAFLKLKELPELKTFDHGKHNSSWPMLKELEVHDCNRLDIFTSEYKNLERLIVDGCQKQKFVFPSLIIESFKQLQHLEIRRCKELKEIVAKEEIEGTTTFIFPRLAFLKLEELSELTTLYHGKYNSNWSMLKELEVRDCNRLDIFTSEYKVVVPNLEILKLCSANCEILWDSQLVATSSCYQNLKSLILNGCGRLQYVFLSSMVKSFERLEHIEICNCSVLKEIVSKGVEANKTFVFSRVTFLKLENLPELATFYSGVHTSEWPVLKKLKVRNCDKIKTFTSEDMSFPDNNEGQHDIWVKHSLFLVDKINPNLEKLTLSRADDMIKLLHQFPENFCRCTIEIKQDKSANISVGILQRSVKLEKLILSGCSYEEIFTCGEDEKHTKTLIHIKSLELSNLSDAKYLWGKGSKLDSLLQNLEVLKVDNCDRMINVLPSSASFENLTVLNVCCCYGLMNLLTPSMAKILVQLREMKIRSCRKMTEIVSNKTEDVAAEDEIVFHKLKLLSLHYLQSLICFYSGNYALKFPSLEELTVYECPMMKTFFVGNLNTPSLQKVQQHWQEKGKWSWEGDLNATIQLLYEKEVNSKSTELILSGKDVILLRQDQLPKHQFFKVEILEIIKDESSNIRIGILRRFNNLKKLVLKSSSYGEIFSYEKDEKHVSMLTQIKELKLQGLFNLEYMWKEKSHLDSILQNLEMLDVDFCHNLISIVPSSATFENLKTLKVQYCDGLINLVSSSTAKSLVRLEQLRLSQCKMMAEVVSSEGGTKAEEIVFDKLKLLSLRNLKNLTSFSSGNYVLKFPALEELIVCECHNMKTFFERVLSVPSLRKVKQESYDELGCWEGDLNATIQFLHRKK